MTQKKKMTGSKISRKSAARLAAVQAVYQMRANGQKAADVIGEYKIHRLGKPVDGYDMVSPDDDLFAGIVSGVEERSDALKEVIDASLSARNDAKTSHRLETLEQLLGSILLCGSFELLAHKEIDAPIVIADYLEVTHSFYEGGEPKLINGVLDRVKTSFRGS